MPRPTAQEESLPIAQWSERHRVISLNIIPLRSWVHLHLKSVKPQSRTKQFPQSILILKEESCPKSLETPWSSVQSQLSSLFFVWIIGSPIIFCFDNPQCWIFSMIPLQSSTNSDARAAWMKSAKERVSSFSLPAVTCHRSFSHNNPG